MDREVKHHRNLSAKCWAEFLAQSGKQVEDITTKKSFLHSCFTSFHRFLLKVSIMSATCMQPPQKPGEDTGHHGTGVREHSELPCGCQEQNPSLHKNSQCPYPLGLLSNPLMDIFNWYCWVFQIIPSGAKQNPSLQPAFVAFFSSLSVLAKRSKRNMWK